MNQASASLPAPVGAVLSRLPAYPGSLLFVSGLNLALARHLPADTQAMLAGKKLRLRVLDAGLGFDFEWRQGAFRACRDIGLPDLLIAASARDFLLLAQRKEDPDTLFFSRRLIMEGDTELGLLVKNTIDAIDVALFDPRQLAPGRVLARLRSALGQAGAPRA